MSVLEIGITFTLSSLAITGIIRLAEKIGLTIPVNSKSKHKVNFTRYQFSCYSGIIGGLLITIFQLFAKNALALFIKTNIKILTVLCIPYLLYIILLQCYAWYLQAKYPRLNVNICNIFPEKRVPMAILSGVVTMFLYTIAIVG